MLMKIILDVLILAVLFVGLVSGYKRGFLKSVARPVRFVASVLTAYWLANPVARKILEPAIKTPITNKINSYLVENCPTITPETASDELPTLLKLAATLLDVDVATLSPVDTIASVVDSLASPVIHIISVIIAFILIYFIAKIVYRLLLSFISSMLNEGVIGLPNKFFGSIFSLLFAMIISWAFVVVFDFVIHSSIFASSLWAQEFEGGILYRFFAKNSPIDILLSF